MSTDIEIEALEREAAEKESKEANLSVKSGKKKFKTANRLDERFQITPEHDPDHIFEEEHTMIKELRDEIEDLRFYSDKWICYFICARRHDMPAVKELLAKYLKIRSDLGFRTCTPDITTDAHKEMREDRLMFRMPGFVDNEGRMFSYFFMSRSRPHGRKFEHLMAYTMWEVDFIVETETLATLRNGFVWVTDLGGFSLMKNLDMSAEGRKWTNSVSGTLPNRVRAVWIIKAGWMFRAVMAAGKVLFPKKMTKRFALTKESDMAKMVPKQYLPKEHGGEAEIDFDAMWKLHDVVTKKMDKRWKKIRKQLRAEARGDEMLNAEFAEKASLKSSAKTESLTS